MADTDLLKEKKESVQPIIQLPHHVSISDIDMPFGSMIRFMIKWALASIPALLILIILAVVSIGLLSGLVSIPFRSALQGINNPSSPIAASEANSIQSNAESAYLPQVRVRNVRVALGELNREGVFGEINNAGEKTLKEVEITIYCLGKDGKHVYETTFHPVVELSIGDDRGQPLKPGYSRKFGVRLDEAPSDWDKGVEVKVTSIKFL